MKGNEMAHECEECGQACDCDGEDTWFDEQPDNCRHFTENDYCEADIFDYEEELVSLHAIYCPCERCTERRAVERESCQPSPYWKSPKKENDAASR